MIPFGNDTVTLIQRIEKIDENGRTSIAYKNVIVPRCSWRKVVLIQRTEHAVNRTWEIVCRIPPNVKPACGDVLILGKVKSTPDSSAALDALLQSNRDDGAMRITDVTDNTRPGFPLPHFAVRGE